MSEAPAVSVVVTAFNEEELVGSAIASVLAQTERNLELIVVDDGSTDGTADVVRRFEADPRLRLIQQENQGLSAARNTGVATSRAERIAFLDSDDLLLPDYLREALDALSARPDAGFAYTDAWLLDDGSNRFARDSAMSYNHPPQDPPRDPEAFTALLIEANFIFVSTTVRRSALDAAGLFDETLTACEDYDLWLRILARGLGAARIPGRPAIKRERAGAMTTDHRNMFANLRRVCGKVAADDDFPADVRATARDRDRELERELELAEGRSGLAQAARRRVFQAAAATVDPLRKRGFWLEATPAEIVAAFPAEEWRRGHAPGGD